MPHSRTGTLLSIEGSFYNNGVFAFLKGDVKGLLYFNVYYQECKGYCKVLVFGLRVLGYCGLRIWVYAVSTGLRPSTCVHDNA